MMETGVYSRIATPFTKAGEFDEGAMREFLQQFIDAKIGVYLTSGGAGEGHSLTWEELSRIYKVGLSECKGKIPVYANPPEKYTVRETRAYTKLAIDCGMELVSIYPIPSRHGMKPTDLEMIAFFDEVLADINHPIIIGVNPVLGHQPSAAAVAAICKKHRQIIAINLSSQNDTYFVDLKDRISHEIKYYVHPDGSLNKLTLGAHGIFGTEANIIPKTFRQYYDLYQARKFDEIGEVYAHITRFSKHSNRWRPSVPRAIKMGMRFLKMPGGEGGLREPYRMPPEEEYKAYCDGLLKLRIPEIDARARAIGIALP